MNKILLAIKSRNSVIAFSTALKERGAPHQIITTPAQAKVACGVSILIDNVFYEKVISIATSMGITISAIFLIKKAGNITQYLRL